MMNFGLLLLSVMGLSLPAMLHFTHTELHGTSSELALSRFAACILLIIYIAFLYFQLMTHRDLYEEEVRKKNEEERRREREAWGLCAGQVVSHSECSGWDRVRRIVSQQQRRRQECPAGGPVKRRGS